VRMRIPTITPRQAAVLRALQTWLGRSLMIIAAGVTASPPPALAVDYTWGNPAGGSWHVDANWVEPGRPVGPSDTAVINLTPGNPYVVDIASSISIGRLSVLSPDATVSVAGDTILNFGSPGLILDGGATLAFGVNAGMKNFSNGSLSLLNGTITGDPNIDLIQSSTLELGTAQEFVGDFSINLLAIPIGSGFLGASALLEVADDQLVAGRDVFIDKSSALAVKATRFGNFAAVTLSPEQSATGVDIQSSLIVDVDPSDGILNEAGTLVNHGSIFVTPGNARASFVLELENELGGVFDAAQRVFLLPSRISVRTLNCIPSPASCATVIPARRRLPTSAA
jgi:hypothetical protein